MLLKRDKQGVGHGHTQAAWHRGAKWTRAIREWVGLQGPTTRPMRELLTAHTVS